MSDIQAAVERVRGGKHRQEDCEAVADFFLSALDCQQRRAWSIQRYHGTTNEAIWIVADEYDHFIRVNDESLIVPTPLAAYELMAAEDRRRTALDTKGETT